MSSDYEEWETVTLEDLLDDGRFDEAEQLLATVPDDDPGAAWAMSLRALCLAELRREEEALGVAHAAVRHDPAAAFGHWTLGTLLSERNRFEEAMATAQQAVRLDPADARGHALVAQIHGQRGEWRACREAAERGLAVEPDDEACSNLRALSLRAADSGEDWSAALDELMQRYPASGWARAGKGWGLLEAGRAGQARASFEQALALDPTSEWAREGLIESIKAANPMYALMLRLFLWLDRLPPRTRWIYILGGLFAFRVLRRATDANAGIAPLTYPLMGGWILFIVASWTAVPLSDFILSRSSAARRLIRGDRRLAGNLVAGLLGLALVAGAAAALTGADRALNAALGAAFLVIPVAAVFQCSPGWPRQVMKAYSAIAVLAGIVAVIGPADATGGALAVVILMSVLGSWIAAWLASRVPARW
ncbi:MAG TPA: hypothetical protein VK939_01355 [Longimicrobiales bacterium]|nr:hypothetical protein [Longimicrobiales bacterium]